MPQNPLCPQLKQSLEELKLLKQRFAEAVLASQISKNTIEAHELRKELIAKINSLQEKLWPCQELNQESIKAQYEEQIEILKQNNLIQEIPGTSQLGSKNHFPETSKEGLPEYFPIPTLENIKEALRTNKELYNEKARQGFTRFQITPVIPLRLLIQGAETALKAKPELLKKADGTLQSNPINRWTDGYPLAEGQGLDESGELVYFPKELKPDTHQGITKTELLKKTMNTATPGYLIELKQADPLITRTDKDTGQGRLAIKTNKSSADYLKDLRADQKKPDSKYQGETLVTPDSRIIEFITQLKYDKTIGDWDDGNDAGCLCAGAYFKSRGVVPYFCWGSGARRFRLDRFVAGHQGSYRGSSASAMVGLDSA